MTDFAKEARDLVARWEHGDEKHRQWLRDTAIPDVESFARRMHAAGVAEGLATAAAIARAAAKVAAEKHNAAPNSIAREEFAGAWKQALDIAEAILAASPPPSKAPE